MELTTSLVFSTASLTAFLIAVKADFAADADSMRTSKIINEYDAFTLLEVRLNGTPHGGYSSLYLVYKDGSALGDGTIVSLPLPQHSFWGNTYMPETLDFSEDGKTLVYTQHFDEKLEVTMDPSIPSRLVHEKGTYTYTVNLETGEVSLEIIE